jgi:hypothetical protein
MSAINGCCWPRFQIRSVGRFGSLARRLLTSTHLAPSFVSRGGAVIQDSNSDHHERQPGIDIYKDPSSFRLSS